MLGTAKGGASAWGRWLARTNTVQSVYKNDQTFDITITNLRLFCQEIIICINLNEIPFLVLVKLVKSISKGISKRNSGQI